MVFEFAVGFENVYRSRLERRAARAPSPPRRAAGAGGRNAETPKDFYVSGPLDAIPARLFFASEPPAPRISQMNLKRSFPPAMGGHFPFPREKGSEKGSGQSVAGVARKPDFLQMSG